MSESYAKLTEICSQYREEIHRLTAELTNVQSKYEKLKEYYAYDTCELEDELAECKKQNELYRLTINAENDRLDRNERLEKELATERMSNLKTYEHNNRLINQVDRYQEALEYLWAIIDDIDTYGDMAKSDDKLFRAMVEHRQNDRWNTGITTDGYTLDLSGIAREALEGK